MAINLTVEAVEALAQACPESPWWTPLLCPVCLENGIESPAIIGTVSNDRVANFTYRYVSPLRVL